MLGDLNIMRTLIATLLLAASSASGAPTAPSVESVAEWIKFSKPVTLIRREVRGNDSLRDGKPLWSAYYWARKQSLESYRIAVYERGSYLAEHRAKLEELISKMAAEFPGKDSPRFFWVDTRADGRKVFFSVSGVGTGGSELTGFTSLPDCDLVVSQISNAEDHAPEDQRILDPAIPTNDLSAIFQKVEAYLLFPR